MSWHTTTCLPDPTPCLGAVTTHRLQGEAQIAAFLRPQPFFTSISAILFFLPAAQLFVATPDAVPLLFNVNSAGEPGKSVHCQALRQEQREPTTEPWAVQTAELSLPASPLKPPHGCNQPWCLSKHQFQFPYPASSLWLCGFVCVVKCKLSVFKKRGNQRCT